MEEEEEAPHTPHIAIFPTPGIGHLIPLIELARKLLLLHPSLTITFLVPDDGSSSKPQKALLQSIPSVNSVFLPPWFETLPDNSTIEARIFLTVIGSIPALLDELNQVGPLSAFVSDLFGAHAFDAVRAAGIPCYLFFTSSAMVLAFSFHLPELDESCDCEYRELPEPVQIPGCSVPVLGSDLVDPVQDRKSPAYRGCLEMVEKFSLADGILVNTFLDLEPETIRSFCSRSRTRTIPPVYPVGPLTRPGSKTGECLEWLDKQPAGSVLFVSFGSGGTLSRVQMDELAAGLEMSRQRFLLVARRPSDKSRNEAYFGDEIESESEGYSGERENGLVVYGWAPQVEVLGHVAVGGFVSHCGWNSTVESIVHGVPMVAWPLFAEQRMNAVLLSEVLKVAIRVRENGNGVVERGEIAGAVRRLMEQGEGIRKRMNGLKDGAAKALTQDGSSTTALANVATKWFRGNVSSIRIQ